MQDSQAYFDGLYGGSDDPYAMRTRWYESRKRAVLLAALPKQRFRRAYEPGCGTGDLTLELAARCDLVLASDFAARAEAIARQRTLALPHVRIERHSLPADWPRNEGPFDLIVLSELGYFLDAPAMHRVAQRCMDSLAEDGTLVACDWRPDFDARVLPTSQVHAELEALGLPRLVRHEEDDFVLRVWSRDGRSVAQREGLR